MDKETADEVLAYARRAAFDTAEITGGAPEFNPHIGYIIEKLAELTRKVSLRTNLTALLVRQSDEIIELCLRNKVTVVASFPSMNRYETNAQRGEEVFERSIEALKMLNKVGYGKEGTCLELILVVNPSGPHLNQDQQAVEQQFREILWKEWGVSFNNLYSLTNVPLGRFGASLKRNGAMGAYLLRLAAHFNPLAVAGLMCRTLVCVSWDGHLYDCDFNLAAGLALAGSRMHVSQMADLPESGTVIPTGTHCYACVAGAGFT
jgi:radical SAM/Cys-rich protein